MNRARNTALSLSFDSLYYGGSCPRETQPGPEAMSTAATGFTYDLAYGLPGPIHHPQLAQWALAVALGLPIHFHISCRSSSRGPVPARFLSSTPSEPERAVPRPGKRVGAGFSTRNCLKSFPLFCGTGLDGECRDAVQPVSRPCRTNSRRPSVCGCGARRKVFFLTLRRRISGQLCPLRLGSSCWSESGAIRAVWRRPFLD